MKQRATSFTRVRPVAIASVAALATLVVGCGDDGTASTGSSTTVASTTTDADATTTTQLEPIGADASLVYFARGEHLGVAGRALPSGDASLEAALRAVLDGPSSFERDQAGLGTEVPEGSELLGVTVSGALATIDLSSEFESGGGSQSMLMRVAQIVYTATEAPGVERITITIDGAAVDGLGGEGLAVDELDRATFDELLPQILVQRPVPRQGIDRDLQVQGLANVFEGTVSIEVLDADGEVVATGFGTGSMGEWSPFDATITIPAGIDGTVIVRCFEESMEDGSARNVVEVPVTLSA